MISKKIKKIDTLNDIGREVIINRIKDDIKKTVYKNFQKPLNSELQTTFYEKIKLNKKTVKFAERGKELSTFFDKIRYRYYGISNKQLNKNRDLLAGISNGQPMVIVTDCYLKPICFIHQGKRITFEFVIHYEIYDGTLNHVRGGKVRDKFKLSDKMDPEIFFHKISKSLEDLTEVADQ